MSLNFVDSSTGQAVGSTSLARTILLAATKETDGELNDKIQQVKNWRKEYLGVYRALAKTEFYQEQNVLEIARLGLEQLSRSIHDDSGRDLTEIVEAGWIGDAQVETFIISGTAPIRPLSVSGISSLTDAAQIWSHEKLAEPGLVGSFKFLDAHKKLPISMDLLIALAGAAEYAPTKHWLGAGGTVAVVARKNTQRWLDLIAHARNSAGTLLVPVLKSRVPLDAISLTDEAIAQNAGLDICDDAEALAGWVAALSMTRKERIVLGQYAYAPGAKHILVQAVQDALAAKVCAKLPANRVALAWLATPTDSTAVPAEVLQDALNRYASRSWGTKLRDLMLGMRKTNGQFFDTRFGEKLALIDPTSTLQGSSYALAKRSQRWRAYLANSQGIKVSYAIAPPARTESVFSFKLLRATFRGAPAFGVQAFAVEDAAVAATALLIRDLHGPMPHRGSTALHTESAIHGGLWRMIYLPKSVWNKATLLGWTALLVADYKNDSRKAKG
jgi:hypothetical protein